VTSSVPVPNILVKIHMISQSHTGMTTFWIKASSVKDLLPAINKWTHGSNQRSIHLKSTQVNSKSL